MKQILVSNGEARRICWTDEDPKLKSGNTIRFKDETEFYKIEKVYDKSIEKNEIKRTWHVGGL